MNKSASRAVDILAFIAGIGHPVGITEVSRALDIPKTSASVCLYTLAEKGYLRMEGTDFLIGPATARLGFAAMREYGVVKMAHPAMEELHRRTGRAVFIAVPDGDTATVLDKIEPPGPVRITIQPGTTLTLHLTAAGKVILAAMSDDEVAGCVGRGCYITHTKNSIGTYFSLSEELAAVRNQGYAVENFEDNIAIYAIAAPIWDSSDKLAAALSLTLLKSELAAVNPDVLARDVMASAAQISGDLCSKRKSFMEE